MNSIDEDELRKKFLLTQQDIFLEILRKFKHGLSMNDLMIKTKLSERTVLLFVEIFEVKRFGNIYKLTE